MKKLLSVIMVFSVASALFGCGNITKKEDTKEKSDDSLFLSIRGNDENTKTQKNVTKEKSDDSLFLSIRGNEENTKTQKNVTKAKSDDSLFLSIRGNDENTKIQTRVTTKKHDENLPRSSEVISQAESSNSKNDESIDEVISIDEEISQAERYAQIVMDNEDIWLEPMNEIDTFTDANFCWFDDVDFDGEFEFVVGGSNWKDIDGWLPSTNRYYIYKFTSDNKMKFIKEFDEPNIDFVAFYANHRYITTSSGHGFSDIGMEVIKHTETGKYERVYISEGTGGDYFGFYTININSDGVTENSLGGFDKIVEFYTENEYWDNIINPIANYMKDAVSCIDKVLAIPCTYMSDGYIVNSYGCYDDLTRSEKLQALIDSYNGYSLEETSNESIVLEKYFSEARTLNREGDYILDRDPDADTVFQMPKRITD